MNIQYFLTLLNILGLSMHVLDTLNALREHQMNYKAGAERVDGQ